MLKVYSVTRSELMIFPIDITRKQLTSQKYNLSLLILRKHQPLMLPSKLRILTQLYWLKLRLKPKLRLKHKLLLNNKLQEELLLKLPPLIQLLMLPFKLIPNQLLLLKLKFKLKHKLLLRLRLKLKHRLLLIQSSQRRSFQTPQMLTKLLLLLWLPLNWSQMRNHGLKWVQLREQFILLN